MDWYYGCFWLVKSRASRSGPAFGRCFGGPIATKKIKLGNYGFLQQKINKKFPQLFQKMIFRDPFQKKLIKKLHFSFSQNQNTFPKSRFLKFCRKVAEKLQKSCSNFYPKHQNKLGVSCTTGNPVMSSSNTYVTIAIMANLPCFISAVSIIFLLPRTL